MLSARRRVPTSHPGAHAWKGPRGLTPQEGLSSIEVSNTPHPSFSHPLYPSSAKACSPPTLVVVNAPQSPRANIRVGGLTGAGGQLSYLTCVGPAPPWFVFLLAAVMILFTSPFKSLMMRVPAAGLRFNPKQ